jgi:hypothetical protein
MQIAFFGARIVLNARRECIIACTPSWRQKAARHPTRPRGAFAGGERKREQTQICRLLILRLPERHTENKKEIKSSAAE